MTLVAIGCVLSPGVSALAGPPHAEHPAAARTAAESARALLRLTAPEDPTYPQLLFRLGTASVDEAAGLEREVRALEPSAGADARVIHLEREVDRLQRQAIDAYTKVVADRRFRAYERRDVAIFELALLHLHRGEHDAMRRLVLQLVRDHPASDRIPGAYLMLGDQLFDDGRYDAAERIYEKVVQFAGADEVAYAHYKWAWCRLHTHVDGRPVDPTSALEHFVAAIRASDDSPAGTALRRSARRDLVIAYAHVGRPTRAKVFFRRVGRGPGPHEDQVPSMLNGLIGAYEDMGRPREAELVRRQLSRVNEASP